MSNPPTNDNIITIPESPPPLPLLRHYSNPNNHLDGNYHHSSADNNNIYSNKYTTPSRLLVATTAATTKSPIPEARQDASSSYEIRTPPQEHRSLVSKDSHYAKNHPTLRQSLLWSRPTLHRHEQDDVAKSGSMDTTSASPLYGWPQRSPVNTEHEADVASFALFTQSFDTISESGHYFREVAATEVDSTKQGENHNNDLPRKIDLKARSNSSNGGNGQQQQPHAKEDASVGKLSPIQLGPEESTPSPPPARAPPGRTNYTNHYHHPEPQFDHHFRGHRPPPHHQHHHPEQQPHYYQYDGPPPPPHGYEEGFGYPPPGYDPRAPRHPPSHVAIQRSNPFFVLRTVHRAFLGCSYLLPCLENREVIPIHLAPHSNFRLLQDPNCNPDATQVQVAKRRVETAIVTFGGYIMLPPPPEPPQDCIFRRRHSGSTKSAWKQQYDDRFHGRYVVKPNHIEWRLEENPPVHHHQMNCAAQKKAAHCTSGQSARAANDPNNGNNADGDCEIMNEENNNGGSISSVVTVENNQKMKYRCKLCGQLKQNHNCPYQQSLQRSIGIMVYAAVNAYTAREPGHLTKSLAEMNNFVSYDGSQNVPKSFRTSSYVTPETKGRDPIHSSPSSLTTVDSMEEGNEDGSTPFSNRAKSRRREKKPFVKTLALRPEHFRAVTPMASEDGFDYQYPHVPLTFQERKRLSDTLFFLSKEIPDMTVPVASLLRTARDRNEWDLCVSELLTQIVVGLYCREGDHRLDGLEDYLLRLGVAC